MRGFKRNFKPLDILTEAQIDMIWETTLDLLEKTGMKFNAEEPRSLQILSEAGCKVDNNTKMVRFPRRLVTDCLSMCPSSFRIDARDPKDSLIIGGDWVSISATPGFNYLDIDTFESRLCTREEYYDNVKIYDALPNLHMLHPESPNTRFAGVSERMCNLEIFVAKLRNSTKPIWGGGTARIAGDHIFPIAIYEVIGIKGLRSASVIPPLTLDEAIIGTIMAHVEKGFPLMPVTGLTWGSSAPVTLSGAVALMSAEVAGEIAFIQTMRPGHPVMLRALTFPQNMRHGGPLFGNITISLAQAAFSQVWRRYGIPTRSGGVGLPNSKCMDFQSGYEKGMNALAAVLCGDSQIELHGCVFGQLLGHPVQAIMDDEIAGMIGRFLRGIEVSDESLAADLMKEVGAGPDFYLNKPHTRKWWRKEQYIPTVADDTMLDEWLRGGKKSIMKRAQEKMEEILATHKVSIPLSPSQDEEIERILAEAREWHRKGEAAL